MKADIVNLDRAVSSAEILFGHDIVLSSVVVFESAMIIHMSSDIGGPVTSKLTIVRGWDQVLLIDYHITADRLSAVLDEPRGDLINIADYDEPQYKELINEKVRALKTSPEALVGCYLYSLLRGILGNYVNGKDIKRIYIPLICKKICFITEIANSEEFSKDKVLSIIEGVYKRIAPLYSHLVGEGKKQLELPTYPDGVIRCNL